MVDVEPNGRAVRPQQTDDLRASSQCVQRGELEENVVVRKSRTTTRHGGMIGKTQAKNVQYYNLDVIIYVGYRVKSQRYTQFRMWATTV